jgi:glycosyl transferase family 25
MAKKKKSDLPIWLLNLKPEKGRRQFMMRQFRALRFDVEVIPALDGLLLTPDDLKMYSKTKALFYCRRELTIGEIGTALSHARMWERMVRENLEEALIFEDDVWISDALPRILANRDKLPPDWEFINFSTDAPQEPFGEFVTGIYRASKHLAPADRSSAYLLNRKGVRKLLDHVYPIAHSSDGLTWRTDITGLISYGIYPRAVILADLGSNVWDRAQIRRPGFAVRKFLEFVYILKTIIRFFGISQLIKKLSGVFRPAPKPNVQS